MAKGAVKTKTKGKGAFGGTSVNFKGCAETMEEIFGPADVGPAEMTKKLWAYVKAKGILSKAS